MAGLGDIFGQSFNAVNGAKAKTKMGQAIIQQETPLNMRGLLEAAQNIPVAGDAISGGMALYDAAKGDYGSAALNALGVLPFVTGTFIGKGAKTFDFLKAADAEKRISAGDDVRKVWKETGTFKGPDGHLRQEIPDNKAFYRGSKAAEGSYAKDVYLNDPLYQAYPGMANTRISEFDGLGGGTNNLGKITVGVKGDASQTAAHEFQHDIQGIEGWARGGSPEEFEDAAKSYRMKSLNHDNSQDGLKRAMDNGGIDPQTGATVDNFKFNIDRLKRQMSELEATGADRDPMWQYKRLAGEAEARATQARMNMNMEQRLNTYPLDSYDVPVDQLIIRGNTPIGAAFTGK